MVSLKDADYSYFDNRYGISPDDVETIRHLKWLSETYGILDEGDGLMVDSNRLFGEQLVFADSRDSLGLQMADILASTLRRACNKQLGPSGWEDFGRLLVTPKANSSRFITFTKDSTQLAHNIARVWQRLAATAKPMFIK